MKDGEVGEAGEGQKGPFSQNFNLLLVRLSPQKEDEA
jgi:hypothetical protein